MLKRILIVWLCSVSICYAVVRDTTITETKDQTIAVSVPNGENYLGIIIIGDTGDGSENQKKVAKAIEKYCAKEVCSFALLLGDNIYEKGVADINDVQFNTKFELPYQDLPFMFFPVLGNHDIFGNWQAEIEYRSPHWYMGGRYYAIDTELANIFALDSNLILSSNFTETQQELEWLQTQLDSATAPWKIVYAHHPIFSHGFHADNTDLIKYIQPLLKRNHVDFYLAGHDHDKELIENDGIKYVISGAGARPRKISKTADMEFAAGTLGFAHLLLTPQTAALKFLDENGKVEFVRKISKGNKARVYDDSN